MLIIGYGTSPYLSNSYYTPTYPYGGGMIRHSIEQLSILLSLSLSLSLSPSRLW